MVKVLVSSCLVGNKVRYNASCLSISAPELLWLKSNAELVIFCPETSAGLPIPRAPLKLLLVKVLMYLMVWQTLLEMMVLMLLNNL
ncbi:2-thiouracil desulfurase family protein [Vibrio diabolicus]|uniref:2-thiouracil desulfurase family protein n=1 Tax=Vibrio diabolicus TaxID=50719 RepID=UPI003750C50A